MKTRWTTLLALGLSGASFAACSGSDDGNPADSVGSSESAICANETRAERFMSGMAKETDGGLKVALAESEPAPPARLDNAWVLSVHDANGEPVLGADLVLDPRMPDHGHGAPRQPAVEELGDGQYSVEPVALSMQGFWTIDVGVLLMGEPVSDPPAESVQFGFCVP